MNADKELFYWLSNPEWYYVNSDGKFELTEKATLRAIRSFEAASQPRSEKKNPYV